MKSHVIAASAILVAVPAQAVPDTTIVTLSASDTAAAFRAAGFKRQNGAWRNCGDPGTAGYVAGSLETAKDFNGDGLPEAVLTESSSYCFGQAETGFWLVSKQAKVGWRLIFQSVGVARILNARGVNGWPDIEIGGPGFCFPVHRWNGQAYILHRYQYEGKRCRPRG